jgi:hypothetical protein
VTNYGCDHAPGKIYLGILQHLSPWGALPLSFAAALTFGVELAQGVWTSTTCGAHSTCASLYSQHPYLPHEHGWSVLPSPLATGSTTYISGASATVGLGGGHIVDMTSGLSILPS